VNGVIAGPKSESGETIEAFQKRSQGRVDNDLWSVPALILIAVYAVVKIDALTSHELPERIQVGLDVLVAAPVIYAATLTFFRMIAGIQVTSDLFDTYAIRVYPHHADRAGGLSPIGRRVTILAWAGAAAGTAAFIINFLSIQKGNNPLQSMESVFGVGVLLVVAPLVIWFWLRAPHEAMLEARGSILAGLSTIFDEVATEPIVLGGTRASITKKLQEGTDLLTALDNRADEIQKTYPSWPIHLTGLRAAWAAVAAPLIAGLIGIVLAAARGLVGV
jgi:hypothetical protein